MLTHTQQYADARYKDARCIAVPYLLLHSSTCFCRSLSLSLSLSHSLSRSLSRSLALSLSFSRTCSCRTRYLHAALFTRALRLRMLVHKTAMRVGSSASH